MRHENGARKKGKGKTKKEKETRKKTTRETQTTKTINKIYSAQTKHTKMAIVSTRLPLTKR